MIGELKRKLRQLKKIEQNIRFGNSDDITIRQYVWDKYFSTKSENDSTIKYNMKYLSEMDHDKLAQVFNEYFCQVYFQYYKDNGVMYEDFFDSELLANIGLPPDATLDMIKSRFRQLAKECHPDTGGDSDEFIKLMITYKKLLGETE